MNTTNSLTSDAVLDALARDIANRLFYIMQEGQPEGTSPSCICGRLNEEWETEIDAYCDDGGSKTFPATREGLVSALVFAGLDIESASDGEGGENNA